MGLRELALGAGSSLPVAREWRRFQVSRTFVPDNDMDVIIHAIGGGGSGGRANTNGSGIGTATGGGAGGYSKKRVTLKAGVSYVFTVGAGGGQVQNSVTGSLPGNDGGDTTVTGGGINMFAGGGKGGNARNVSSSTITVTALAGGAGGPASGGDINRPGGRGGNIAAGSTVANSGVYLCQATGGGAVNLLGDAECHGGDVAAITYSSNGFAATGGGGIGEDGFPISTTTNYSYGGGLGSLTGTGDGAATTLIARSFMGFWGVLGPRSVNTSSASGPGAGGCGGNTSGYPPGDFAGSGGWGQYNAASITGLPTYGGGSGGMAGGSTASTSGSNAGGKGAIFLEILS